MPVHDLGYREWDIERSSGMHRWSVIAATGIRLAMRSSWLRRLLLVAWLPATTVGMMFFAYEQAVNSPPWERNIVLLLQRTFAQSDLTQAISVYGAENMRHEVWSFLILFFFRTPQAVLMVMLVALVGPRLIANDVRSRAFLIYFSRPISPWQYVLGKSAILWTFLMAITTLPALVLYFLGVLLSPNISVVAETWDIPVRIMAASSVLIIPTSAVALCLSSMTSESRFAASSWISIWVVGWVSYVLLEGGAALMRPGKMAVTQWTLVSPYHTLGRIQSWVFGVEADIRPVLPSIALVSLITALAIWRLMRQVTAPIRV